MLAHVRQRFLDDAKELDARGRRQQARIGEHGRRVVNDQSHGHAVALLKIASRPGPSATPKAFDRQTAGKHASDQLPYIALHLTGDLSQAGHTDAGSVLLTSLQIELGGLSLYVEERQVLRKAVVQLDSQLLAFLQDRLRPLLGQHLRLGAVLLSHVLEQNEPPQVESAGMGQRGSLHLKVLRLTCPGQGDLGGCGGFLLEES